MIAKPEPLHDYPIVRLVEYKHQMIVSVTGRVPVPNDCETGRVPVLNDCE